MTNTKIIGIDIAKNIFQLHGATMKGIKSFTKRVSRVKLTEFILHQPEGALIVMEACSTSNYWARKFTSMGFPVKLISPQFVKPFVKGNKNDGNDAQAIVEAALRPDMRFVPIKTLMQQDMQSLHRIRSLLIKNRTSFANHMRGLLAEYGVIIPQGINMIRCRIMSILEDAENELTLPIRELILTIYEQFKSVDQLIGQYDKQISQHAKSTEQCSRLMKLPGIGPLIATALFSAVGNGINFKCGREMSAWMGLTPKHRASGNKKIMQGISKRGDKYLRQLIIHGSRSVLLHCRNKSDARNRWAADKLDRLGYPKASVALANKTVRETWALLNKGEKFVYTS